MTTNILLVGNNEQQANNWIKLLNDHNKWKAKHALTDEEAIEKFHQYHFDVVVLGNDLSADAVKKLNKLCTFQQENVIVLNNTADLAENISEALKVKQRSNATFSFIDDALKNSGLNITLQ
ncbi:MAG: hypothetical protein HYX40_05880 [Sphingobacteriales bacterium]|nr:hypothetical protein [Sphingobacteriales bacterium]